MDRNEFVKKGLLYTCFLENINGNEIEKIAKIREYLKSLSDSELEEYCNVNCNITEVRLERFMNY